MKKDGTSTPPMVSIVVPTYNEREGLSEFIEALTRVMKAHGINGEAIVVDDNSPDGTWSLAEQLATRYPVRVIRRAGKLGLASAVREGFAATASPILGVMDADLSHPPDVLPHLVAALERGADMVIGSRYIPGGATRDWPLERRVMSRIACAMGRPLTPVRDVTSGLFLIRREALADVPILTRGFKIALDLMVCSRAQSIIEVPYVFSGRSAGQSKMDLTEVFGYLRQLAVLTLWRWRMRSTHLCARYQCAAGADIDPHSALRAG